MENQDILALIERRRGEIEAESREVVIAEPREVVVAEGDKINDLRCDLNAESTLPREVLKNKKIKQLISRPREDNEGRRSSDEDLPLAGASPTPAESSTPVPENPKGPAGERGSVVPAAATISSRVAAITAQHNKTTRGVKVSLTIQTPEDQAAGVALKLTAELKRSNRLREVRAVADDSEMFQEFLRQARESITELADEERSRWVMGRCHARGSRSSWFKDMLVIGQMDSGRITTLLVYIEGEEIEIGLADGDLTARQRDLYNSSGQVGQLRMRQTSPSFGTAQRRPLA